MKTSRCPHCRQQLGNYLYATQCPFCHKEIAHNQKQNASTEERSTPALLMVAAAGIAIFYVLLQSMGVPLPGWREPSSVGGYALRILIAGLVGAALGFILSSFMSWHAKGERRRRAAFLASFKVLSGGVSRHTPLPIEVLKPALPESL
jgi:hypothetical protein